jgi:hypothetical protein
LRDQPFVLTMLCNIYCISNVYAFPLLFYTYSFMVTTMMLSICLPYVNTYVSIFTPNLISLKCSNTINEEPHVLVQVDKIQAQLCRAEVSYAVIIGRWLQIHGHETHRNLSSLTVIHHCECQIGRNV